MPNSMFADARPTKKFFIDNLTRDLTLEDAILDLVDNSIDAFIRTRDMDVSSRLLKTHRNYAPSGHIKIQLSKEEFRIEDTCGGMDLNHARDHVFRLGRPEGTYQSALGVYGIGLKRALFKIGENIEVVSKTTRSAFRTKIDVPAWSRDDDTWTFPLEEAPTARNRAEAGTRIVVRELTPEVKLRLGDGVLLKRLVSSIESTYAFFLGDHLVVEVNGSRTRPRRPPLAATDLLKPNSTTFERDGIEVSLVAGLSEKEDDEWNAERAGWYVLCNGRVVVRADKTELTGWGLGGPSFVSKHRGFLGVAFFFSQDPSLLPWTTTKRGLNRDSAVYQFTRGEMATLARPVLSFLNSFYPSEPAETKPAREIVKELKPADLAQVLDHPGKKFPSAVPGKRGRKSTTVRIQFDAERADVDRVRRVIGKPKLAAGAIGRFTFEHFLKTECSE